MNWYALHVYSGREFPIKEAILKGLEGTPLAGFIGEILIPTQKTFHIREGKKVEREKKIFNSYIIIEADLTPELMSYIRNIPGVTHFLGSTNKPAPLSESEVKRLLGIFEREENEEIEYEFIAGDMVKIVFGPFSDFDGIVDKVNQDSKKLTVNVALNMDQVERIKKI
jgi:transcriptional antiterminator NusG